jgi:hypothetical protein
MSDNTDWFADVQAALDDSATEEVIETESVPEQESTPESDESLTVVDEAPTEDVTTEAEESAEESAPIAEQSTEPIRPNWDSPDNPYYEPAKKLTQLQQLTQRLQEQQAEKLAQERVRALADDDPQRVAEIQQFLAQTQQPLWQQLDVKEQEVEYAAKLATVYDEAVKFVLTPEQHALVRSEAERMMRLPGGPDYLQHDLATRTSERSQYQQQLDKANKRIAELERGTSVAAQVNDRLERKADLVDSGSGAVTSLETRWNDASNFDEAFDVISDLLPKGARRSA